MKRSDVCVKVLKRSVYTFTKALTNFKRASVVDDTQKVGEDRTCSFGDNLADRQTHRQQTNK